MSILRVMPRVESNAHIKEEGQGAYYNVRLEFVPREGDLIDLWSYEDQGTGHPPAHRYEVVKIVHKVYDISDKTDPGGKGGQFVTVIVRDAISPHFE